MLQDLYSLLLILCIGAILCVVYLKFWNLLQLSRQFEGPPAYPLIGNGASFLCKPQVILERVLKLSAPYKSPVRLWLGPQLVILVSDPEQLQIVMQSSKMAKKSFVYRFLEPFLGKGLFTSFGLQHKTHRRILQALFAPKYVEGYSYIFQKHANNLVDYIEKYADTSREFDVDHYVHLCGLETTMDIVLGMKNNDPINFACLPQFIMRFYHIFTKRVTCFWLQYDFIYRFTGYYKEEKEMLQISNQIIKDVSDLKRAEIEQYLDLKYDNSKSMVNNNLSGDDERIPSILESILEILREDPNILTEQEITDHLRTFVVTSQDTQGSGIAFALMMFGMFPDIQKKVYDELTEHTLQTKDSIITIDIANNLKYLEMCIKETMRLFPVGPFLMRECTKGCEVVLAIYNVHKNPKYWQRPNDFYPEHFTSEAIAKRHPFAFLPFSAGPRRCIAQQYSYLNMKIILGTILKKYEIICKENFENLQLTTDVSIRPVNGYKIIVKKHT